MNSRICTYLRWLIAFIIVLLLHAVLAHRLTAFWQPHAPTLPAMPDAVMIEFPALEPSAVANKAAQQTPAAEVAKVEPEPVVEPEIVPETVEIPKAKLVIATKPKPQPKPKTPPKPKVVEPKKPPTPIATNTTTQTNSASTGAANNQSSQASTQAAANKAQQANITSIWLGQINAYLKRYQRYPQQAKNRRQQGIVKVNFTVDRSGNVTNIKLVSSSGFSALDNAALVVLRKASPIPKPPAEILQNNSSININFPISYILKN